VLFLAWLVVGDPALGVFGYVFLGALALVMLPLLIAIVFSIWAAGRPSAPVAP
jgi:hypothetical protein